MKTNLINKISTVGIAVAVFGLVALSNPFSTGANNSSYGYYGSSPIVPTIACDSRVSGSECSTSTTGNTNTTTETTTTTVNSTNNNGTNSTTETSTTTTTNSAVNTNTITNNTNVAGTTNTNSTKVKDSYVADSAETGIKNYVKVLPKTGASN